MIFLSFLYALGLFLYDQRVSKRKKSEEIRQVIIYNKFNVLQSQAFKISMLTQKNINEQNGMGNFGGNMINELNTPMIQHHTLHDTYLSGNQIIPRISNLNERERQPTLGENRRSNFDRSILNTFTTTMVDNQPGMMDLTESQFLNRLHAPVHDQGKNQS